MSPQSPATPALHRLLVAAAQALAQFAAGRNLDAALDEQPAALRAGAQALAYAGVRRWASGGALLRSLVPRKAPPLVEALLRLALTQLRGEGTHAPHTVVNQAVQAVRSFAGPQAGLVNAVLRRYLREAPALEAALPAETRHEHPAWWAERLRKDWPAQAEALLSAAQRPPPLVLRVNPRRTTRAAYLVALAEAGIAAQALGEAQAVWIEHPVPVTALPGFAQGWVSVQDLHAQRAGALLLDAEGRLPPLPAGARVLDACAAPGGKTAQLLELAELDLLALDLDASRLRRVDESLQRLGLQARTQAADAAQPAHWWDGRAFDAILLDAPCSASGIGRRHPDVRWLRRESDLATLQATQARLLDALWPLLAPCGRLLYATCSLFAAEGREVLDAFLQRQPAAQRVFAPGRDGHLLGLPENEAPLSSVTGDGFFYALLVAR